MLMIFWLVEIFLDTEAAHSKPRRPEYTLRILNDMDFLDKQVTDTLMK